jgi:hypothetical protein
MGSDWLRATIASADETMVVFSQLLIIEVTSALNRRVREGAITPEDYPRVLGIFHTTTNKKGGNTDATQRLAGFP